MPEPILTLTDAVVAFDALRAVDGVNLSVPRGQRRAIIGPNGAGKTTLFNAIAGLVPPSSGRIMFDGHDITRLPPHRRAQLGISRTFQITNLFPALSVGENIRLAAQARHRRRFDPIATALSIDAINAETDATIRAELAHAVFADDGRLVDPLIEAEGPEQVAAAVGQLQDQMPGHALTRTTVADAHHTYARFGWTVNGPDGTVAVDELDFVAPSGQITVLVGTSGCGKTTSLRMINRMIDPTGGRILIDDVDAELDREQRRLGAGDMGAGLAAAVARGLDRGGEFGLGDLADLRFRRARERDHARGHSP